MRLLLKNIILAAVFACVGLDSSDAQADFVSGVEDFDTLNLNIWQLSDIGVGASIVQSSGSVILTDKGNGSGKLCDIAGAPADTLLYPTSLKLKERFEGNFDIKVAFSGAGTATTNYLQFGMQVHVDTNNVARVFRVRGPGVGDTLPGETMARGADSQGSGTYYGPTYAVEESSDGYFRMVRTGSSVEMFDGTNSLGTHTIGSGDASIVIGLMAPTGTTKTLSIDSFTITSGTLVADYVAEADMNMNGYPDMCDSDADGDGLVGGQDNCPLVDNVGQEDVDDNGVGDACQDTQRMGTFIGGIPLDSAGGLACSKSDYLDRSWELGVVQKENSGIILPTLRIGVPITDSSLTITLTLQSMTVLGNWVNLGVPIIVLDDDNADTKGLLELSTMNIPALTPGSVIRLRKECSAVSANSGLFTLDFVIF